MPYKANQRYPVRCLNCGHYLGAYTNVTTGHLEFFCDRPGCKGHTHVWRDGKTVKQEFVRKSANPGDQAALRAA